MIYKVTWSPKTLEARLFKRVKRAWLGIEWRLLRCVPGVMSQHKADHTFDMKRDDPDFDPEEYTSYFDRNGRLEIEGW